MFGLYHLINFLILIVLFLFLHIASSKERNLKQGVFRISRVFFSVLCIMLFIGIYATYDFNQQSSKSIEFVIMLVCSIGVACYIVHLYFFKVFFVEEDILCVKGAFSSKLIKCSDVKRIYESSWSPEYVIELKNSDKLRISFFIMERALLLQKIRKGAGI